MAVFSILLAAGGCSYMGVEHPAMSGAENAEELGVYSGFTPTEIVILPLTHIFGTDGAKETSGIEAYVSMTDRFGNQIKSPALFRFELYEKIQRSSEPKGVRAVIWPDMDLRDPVGNNRYWQDFLRAYKFNLNFKPLKDQNYVLQVTCFSPAGRRLSAEYGL